MLGMTRTSLEGEKFNLGGSSTQAAEVDLSTMTKVIEMLIDGGEEDM